MTLKRSGLATEASRTVVRCAATVFASRIGTASDEISRPCLTVIPGAARPRGNEPVRVAATR